MFRVFCVLMYFRCVPAFFQLWKQVLLLTQTSRKLHRYKKSPGYFQVSSAPGFLQRSVLCAQKPELHCSRTGSCCFLFCLPRVLWSVRRFVRFSTCNETEVRMLYKKDNSEQAVFIFSIAFFIWSFIIVLCRTMSNPFDLFKHNTTTNQLFVQVTQICNCISPIHIATIHTVFSKIFHKTIKRIFVIKTIRLFDLVKFSLKRTQSETFSASFCVLFYCLLLLPA